MIRVGVPTMPTKLRMEQVRGTLSNEHHVVNIRCYGFKSSPQDQVLKIKSSKPMVVEMTPQLLFRHSSLPLRPKEVLVPSACTYVRSIDPSSLLTSQKADNVRDIFRFSKSLLSCEVLQNLLYEALWEPLDGPNHRVRSRPTDTHPVECGRFLNGKTRCERTGDAVESGL